MRRLLVLVALAGGMIFLTPTAALACACGEPSTAANVEQADTVVEGTLAWTSNNGFEASYGVDVEKVFKGKAAVFEKLRSAPDKAGCGLGEFATQQRYVFFLQGEHPGQMLAGRCGGIEPATGTLAADVQAVTGAATDPLPPRKPTAEAGSQGLGFIGWTVVVAGVGLLVLLGTTALRRSF